jgi:hypothetical protein
LPLWQREQSFSLETLKAFIPVWQAPQDLVFSISAMVKLFLFLRLNIASWQILQLLLYFFRWKSWLNTTGSEFLNLNFMSLVSAAPAQTTVSMHIAAANDRICFSIGPLLYTGKNVI